MSEALHQLNVTISNEEDRLLLRVSTTAKHEYRLWLTRRFVRALWDLLVKAVERHAGAAVLGDEEVRKALLSFQHEAAVKGADFKTAYAAAEFDCPFGEKPVLLIGAQLKAGRAGSFEMTLQTIDDRSVSVRLDAKLLHSLCSILSTATKKAEWGLDLRVGTPLGGEATPEGTKVH
jgi:hypothetical protein